MKFLGRAYGLAPQERSVALLYAEAKLRNGESAEAAALLEPFAGSESDVNFLETFADALRLSGQLDRSRGDPGTAASREKRRNHAAIRFGGCLRGRGTGCEIRGNSADAEAEDVCGQEKRGVYRAAGSIGRKTSRNPCRFWNSGRGIYNELNRESQYFEVLIKLFDANFNSGNFQKSSEVLERLVDIDSYDYRNQERLEKLRGHADETFLRRVAGRMAKAVTRSRRIQAPPKIVG